MYINPADGTRTKSIPTQEAERALRVLYSKKLEQLGYAPDYDNFYPINLMSLALALGWRIERVSMTGHSASNEPIDAEVNFEQKILTVSVDENMPLGRVNFSIAHELGHILLHSEKGSRALWRTRGIREKIPSTKHHHPFEIEADRFATEILMPPKAVIFKFHQFFKCWAIVMGSSIAEHISKQVSLDKKSLARSIANYSPGRGSASLAHFFGVSIEAMAIRLLELRCVLD